MWEAVLNNCEAWGNVKVKDLETLYRKALKYLLGVRTQVCNEFPYIELQKPTLTSMIYKRQYIFYKNCTVNRDWPLQRYIIRKALDVSCSFITHYTKLTNQYSSAEEITTHSLEVLKNDVMKKASLGQSRYVTYVTTNPTLTRPKIYSKYVPTVKLHKTTQLRLVSHNLQIELGRHRRPVVLREERLCTCGAVETECHFLFECMQYYHIRCKYNLNINELSEVLDDTFTCDYVDELFNCRGTFL